MKEEGCHIDSVGILLEEYKTLRQESLTAMNNRNRVLSFGLAAIGAILTGSILAYKENGRPIITILILIIIIPVVSNFILLMWLGEYERMQRAGKFLAKLEEKINEIAKDTLLTWETQLRGDQSHMKYPYYATVLLLIGISSISLVLGLIITWFSEIELSAALRVLVAIVGAHIHIGFGLFVKFRISKLSA